MKCGRRSADYNEIHACLTFRKEFIKEFHENPTRFSLWYRVTDKRDGRTSLHIRRCHTKSNKYLQNKINGFALSATYDIVFFRDFRWSHYVQLKPEVECVVTSEVYRTNFQCVTKGLKHITMLSICIISFMYQRPTPTSHHPRFPPCKSSADEIPSRHYNCKFPFIHETLPRGIREKF
jgi:hypothetical protein